MINRKVKKILEAMSSKKNVTIIVTRLEDIAEIVEAVKLLGNGISTHFISIIQKDFKDYGKIAVCLNGSDKTFQTIADLSQINKDELVVGIKETYIKSRGI